MNVFFFCGLEFGFLKNLLVVFFFNEDLEVGD